MGSKLKKLFNHFSNNGDQPIEPLSGSIRKEISHMMVIPRHKKEISDPEKLFSQLKESDEFSLVNIARNDRLECPTLYIQYKEHTYLIDVEPQDFDYNDFGIKHRLSDENIEALRAATHGLTLSMQFDEDNQLSFLLMLKVIYCLVPNLIGVVSYNSYTLLSPLWVAISAGSQTPPAPSYLYTVHAVNDENGEVWLHSHGLNRCGIRELEIVGVDQTNYANHATLLDAMADKAISENELENEKEPVYVASLPDGGAIINTWVNWQEGISRQKISLGGEEDRDDVHSGNTGLIFTYLSEKDYKKGKYAPLSLLKEDVFENPLIIVSTKETERMQALARERYSYLKAGLGWIGATALVKVGLKIDEEFAEEAGIELEHIWFEVREITDEGMTAALIQEPYYVRGMHEGAVKKIEANELTDWILYIDEMQITPDSVYLLSVLTKGNASN